MSDPKRWLESDEASGEVLELLRVGKPPSSLDAVARARSVRRVTALGAVPLAAAASVSWPQIALGAGIGMIGTLATMSALQLLLGQEPPTARIPAASSAKPIAIASRAVPLRDAPLAPVAASSTPPPRPSPQPSSASSEAPPFQDQLAQEIALLESARRKLSSSPSAALSALRDHELRFPAGQLRIEREFLIVDALVRLGRRPEAEARARALAQQAPQSLYGERLQRILNP